MGDDQPRSWMRAGAAFGNGNPDRRAWMVDQRGVGISSTRT